MHTPHLPPTRFLVHLLALATLIVGPALAQRDIPTSDQAEKAIAENTPRLGAEAMKAGLRLGNPVYIRIFKEEKVLELWVQNSTRFKLFKSFPVCTWGPGALGPKTRTGDGQAPEGFYFVPPQALNPWSHFHLSFNLGYPNRYDRVHQRTGTYLMVHGRCVSLGCFAMTDPAIEEIYTFCAAAFRGGQPFFRVHIFPFRMTDANLAAHRPNPWYPFWLNLKQGYDAFEQNGFRPPNVDVENARYVFNLP